MLSGKIDRPLLEAFSRGEVMRREIAEQSGTTVGFGDLLAQLHEHNLPLPRIRGDRQSPGVQLIRRLTERAMQRAG